MSSSSSRGGSIDAHCHEVFASMKASAKRLLARLFARAAVSLSADPAPHSDAVAAQGGFLRVSDLLRACDGDGAAALLRKYGASVGIRPMIATGVTIEN